MIEVKLYFVDFHFLLLALLIVIIRQINIFPKPRTSFYLFVGTLASNSFASNLNMLRTCLRTRRRCGLRKRTMLIQISVASDS